MNDGNAVDCLFGVNPSLIRPYSSTQKNRIWFHRSNNDGYAGGTVSTGCILIVPSGHGENGWNEFNDQLKPVSSFHFVLNRTAGVPLKPFISYPLQTERDLKNRNFNFLYDLQRKL